MTNWRPADCCYGGALLTLPLTGVGLIHLTTGRDVGAGLQPAYLLLALAWLLQIVRLLTRGGACERARLASSRSVRRGLPWLGAAAAAVLLSAMGLRLVPAPVVPHEAWPRFAKQVIQLGIMAACLLYPALWTRGPRRWRWTLTLLAWAAAGQLLYAGLQAVHQLTPLPFVDTLEHAATSNPAILAGSDRLYLGGFTAVPRLRGTMSEPLYLGSFLLGVVPMLALRGRRVLLALGLVALVLTWSRGAWLATVVGAGVWWLLRRRAGLPGPSRRLLAVAAGGLVGGAVILLLVAGPETLSWPLRRLAQMRDGGDWSNLTRIYSAQAAWRCFLASPLVGVGWGQFPYHFYALVDITGLSSQFQWPVVNSVPLLVLAETGLVGALVAAGMVAAVWRATWQRLATERDPARAGRLAATAAAGCALGLQLLFFSQYNLPHLWVVPGLWLAALADGRKVNP